MTIEQAIRVLEGYRLTISTFIYEGRDCGENEAYQAYGVAIEALEKQIAKRPIGISVSHEGRLGNCPCCKKLVYELYDIVGCSECLQKLNWGKENGNK